MQSFSSFRSPRLYCEQERQFLLTSVDRSLFLVWSGYLGLNSPFTYSISFVSIKSSNHKFHRHFIVLCQPLRHKRLKPAVKAKISLLVTLSWRSAHSGWPHFTWETLELCLCFLDTCWHTHGRTISPKTKKNSCKNNFQSSVDSNPGLHWIWFTRLNDWSKKLTPPPWQIRLKTDRDFVIRVYPRLRKFNCYMHLLWFLIGSL